MKVKSGNKNTMNLKQKKVVGNPLTKYAVLYRKGNIYIYKREDGLPPKEK